MNDLADLSERSGYPNAERMRGEVLETRSRLLGRGTGTRWDPLRPGCLAAVPGDREAAGLALAGGRRRVHRVDTSERDGDLVSLHGPKFGALVERTPQRRRSAGAGALSPSRHRARLGSDHQPPARFSSDRGRRAPSATPSPCAEIFALPRGLLDRGRRRISTLPSRGPSCSSRLSEASTATIRQHPALRSQFVEIHRRRPAPRLSARRRRAVDQDQRIARPRREEVMPIVDLGARLVDQFEIRLVHQAGGVQGASRPASRQLPPGQPLELVIDDGEQPVETAGRALPPEKQQAGDLALGLRIDRVQQVTVPARVRRAVRM